MSYGANAKPDGGVIAMIAVELVTLPMRDRCWTLHDQFEPS